ncbi:MAG: GNAT family N-acetyltransferase [Oscillospiraceae bacterium]|jgi:hypothetical protein|nr:GNAT family N-acetyltransferase [Oscillospiraceae bacterium]
MFKRCVAVFVSFGLAFLEINSVAQVQSYFCLGQSDETPSTSQSLDKPTEELAKKWHLEPTESYVVQQFAQVGMIASCFEMKMDGRIIPNTDQDRIGAVCFLPICNENFSFDKGKVFPGDLTFLIKGIFESNDDVVDIGRISITVEASDLSSARLGVFILSHYEGMGIPKVALEFLFETIESFSQNGVANIKKITAKVNFKNLSMIDILKKAGFELEQKILKDENGEIFEVFSINLEQNLDGNSD